MARADRDPDARSRAACVGCHTTWGFLERTAASTAQVTARRPPEEAGTLGIACPACHDAHAAGHDGSMATALLRVVKLPDLFDEIPARARARSGTCIACHAPDREGGLARASAAAIWAGRGGIDVDTGLPLIGPAPHLEVPGGCVGCHADGPEGLQAGKNHAFRAKKTQCDACHLGRSFASGPLPFEGEARDLWKRLLDRRVVGRSEDKSRIAPPHASTELRSGRGTPLERAAFNLSLILEDPAAATHNPRYAQQLVDNARKAIDRRP
jgi:hypothetical protein